jgi:hypothetical protein
MPNIVPSRLIESRIYEFRGTKVMVDSDLAELYDVQTKALNQAVTRNSDRFPEDFMFRLTDEEFGGLRSQTVTSSWGGRRYRPRVFTEHGILMLANVLRNERAITVSVQIIRVFNAMRKMIGDNEELIKRLRAIERRQDIESKEIWKAIRLLQRHLLED